jgi:hemolysin III
VTLTFLRPTTGWLIFGLVWGLAFTGTVLKTMFGHRYNVIATLGYVVMGWLLVIAYNPMLNEFPRMGLLWIIMGGLFYTGGVAFYLLDSKIKYFHALWHICVLSGSICHFIAVYYYVIPL